jgi:hypothetical protein
MAGRTPFVRLLIGLSIGICFTTRRIQYAFVRVIDHNVSFLTGFTTHTTYRHIYFRANCPNSFKSIGAVMESPNPRRACSIRIPALSLNFFVEHTS